MKIIDGKLFLEEVSCPKEEKRQLLCPRWGQKQRGTPCPHCGAKNQHDHKTVGEYTVKCTQCGGTGKKKEEITDPFPTGLFGQLTFKVFRAERELTWNEQHLGAGCVFSCVDYGEAWKGSDKELIVKVKAHTWIQACKVAKDDGKLCSYVGIFVAPHGYSVRAIFE